MGKSLFAAVKKVLSQEQKSKRKWFVKDKNLETFQPHEELSIFIPSPPPLSPTSPPALHSPLLWTADSGVVEIEDERIQHADSLALAAAAAVPTDTNVATANDITGSSQHCTEQMGEEMAAIKIQTAFRRFMARRALRALRGWTRLQRLVKGQSVRRQATNTLQSMQTLVTVQTQIRERRKQMSLENQARAWKLEQTREKELENTRVSVGASPTSTSTGGNWNLSRTSKEEFEAKLLNQQDAAMRRQKALAYASKTQQTWKNSSKPTEETNTSPLNPHLGWSWLERWMATRPLDTTTSPTGEKSTPSTLKARSFGRESNNAGNISAQHRRRHSIGGLASARTEEECVATSSPIARGNSVSGAKSKAKLSTPSSFGSPRSSIKKQLSFTGCKENNGSPRPSIMKQVSLSGSTKASIKKRLSFSGASSSSFGKTGVKLEENV